ncbi:T9SS type A sorting domain-containing protein [Fluviicola sp.]|uniref:T9SS type A sorting domain-containing protein n=1 Tax=Fluviicola sp. TaxID=1917219 RepID=UPI0031D7F42C
MSKYLFSILLLLGITARVNAQDMMLNGSFEQCDGVAPPGSDPYSIEYGAYWHNLTGTSDLINPCVPNSVSGSPCFGDGCGRFGLNGTGYIEYLYGTTLPLTAGQIYEVSFWIKKDYSTESIRKVGLAITETVPTPSITSTTPLISELISSTQCVKLKACFTAQNSVTHYVTIGPFGGAAPESILYLVDSVSVMTIPPTTPLAQASLSASEPVLCFGEQVTLDGTGSSNETSYEWKIYNITNGPNLFYSSGIIQGTAGTLTPSLSFPVPGSCYRAELTVYGVCKDVATVEFCIADPSIDFISDGNPVCENFPVDLQVTGDNGWTYTWSQGSQQLATGTGLKTLTVTPTIGNATYSVTVTTPEGCTHTETLTLNVNSPNNIAPWMDGINGTGEYTYYVTQGDAVFFNSLLSNDHINEEILYSNYNTIPNGFTFNYPPEYGGLFSLSWVTSFNTPTGEYHYFLTANDQNACGVGIDTFDFRIIVVCDQCPICVNYENRTPSGTPLPAETKAGKCIEAGLNQTVSTGDANVLFQAGLSITEGPYFDAGPGYEGVIEPTTCVTDCEDCCTDWDGFTYDELPNPFYMNFDDEDPTNDFVQVTDTYHPFCAFNAKGYSFEIVDGNGNLMNNDVTGYQGSPCCALESPAPENPIAHSSIWWDGYTENIFGNTVRPNDGVYFYVLTLYGCNGQEVTIHGFIHVFGSNGMMQAPGGTQQAEATLAESPLGPEQQRQLEESIAKHDRFDRELSLSPNPTTDIVTISGVGPDDVFYQIFDDKGIMISRKEKAENQSFSLTNYSKGTYYIRIYSGTTYTVRKVVKM